MNNIIGQWTNVISQLTRNPNPNELLVLKPCREIMECVGLQPIFEVRNKNKNVMH
jgi:hypothetical protein